MPKKLPEPFDWFRELVPDLGTPSPWLLVEIPPTFVDAGLEEQRSCASLPNNHPELPDRQRFCRQLTRFLADRWQRDLAHSEWTTLDGHPLIGLIHQAFAIEAKLHQLDSVIRSKHGDSLPPDTAEYIFTLALLMYGEESLGNLQEGKHLALTAWTILLAAPFAVKEFHRRATERTPDDHLTDRAKAITAIIALHTVTCEETLLPQENALVLSRLLEISNSRLKNVLAFVADTLQEGTGLQAGPPPLWKEKGQPEVTSDPQVALGTLLYHLCESHGGWFSRDNKNHILALALDGKISMSYLLKRMRSAVRWSEEGPPKPRQRERVRFPSDEPSQSKLPAEEQVVLFAPRFQTPDPETFTLVKEVLKGLVSHKSITAQEHDIFLRSSQGEGETEIGKDFGMTKQNVYYHV
ncbi:MAG: hypothetical protein AAB393_08860, partial [Bacteroidota bacterium]